MTILALDQAARITGYSIFKDLQLITYGKIDLSKETDQGIRLHKLRQSIKDLIESNNIDKVYLEDIYMDGQKINNVSTFKILAEVFGVLYELCIDLNKPVEAILSGTWKSILQIKGKTRPEQKHAAQAWVANTYNIKPTQDECDAICIGACALKQQEFNWDE